MHVAPEPDLDAIRDEWAALWARVPDATPFQHPAWLIPWWRHVGEGELLMLSVRDANGLAALFPLYIYRRRLFPLGVGTTDWLDALVVPGEATEATTAMLAHLGTQRARFDVIEWPQLRTASPLLRGTAPRGWQDTADSSEPCPVLRLPTRFDALGQHVSAKTLRDLRTARRRAADAGARFEDATAATLEEYRDALFRLHAARWEDRGEPGVLAAAAVQAMHRDAMPRLLRAGLLRMLALRLNGAVVAVLYALADPPGRTDRTLYLYLQGFDPALERLSPGLLLVGETVERSIAEGFAVLDFLRGQERYKSFWGAVSAPSRRRLLIPETPMDASCPAQR